MILAAALAATAAAGLPAETVAGVEAFLKIPIEQLKPEPIGMFMELDIEQLPKPLRKKAFARRAELLAMKRVSEIKKKGFVLSAEPNCEAARDGTDWDIAMLKGIGFVEIEEDEKLWLERTTLCSERKMLCEFSLQIRDQKKKGGPHRRYFLYCRVSCDPLMALIAARREGLENKGTAFFGRGGIPKCN